MSDALIAINEMFGRNVASISFNKEKNRLVFTEGCDSWFSVGFSKQDVQKLIDLLTLLLAEFPSEPTEASV
jgi:hypothetical protein